MIDSKKLAATPLHQFERGSNEFFMAVMCHFDRSELNSTETELALAVQLDVQTGQISKWVKKGRDIRDRLILDGSNRALRKVAYGEAPAPKVVSNVPELRQMTTSRMLVEREPRVHAMQGPSILQQDFDAAPILVLPVPSTGTRVPAVPTMH